MKVYELRRIGDLLVCSSPRHRMDRAYELALGELSNQKKLSKPTDNSEHPSAAQHSTEERTKECNKEGRRGLGPAHTEDTYQSESIEELITPSSGHTMSMGKTESHHSQGFGKRRNEMNGQNVASLRQNRVLEV